MNEIEIYNSPDNNIELQVNFDNETVWLSQSQITELFQRGRTVITKHINNVFKESELDRKSNVQKMHIANSNKPVEFYNLDVIISVGYRIKSKQGTQFRQWATKRLKDYLVKGFALKRHTLNVYCLPEPFGYRSGQAKVEGLVKKQLRFDLSLS
jgi:hypothetical protein